LLLTSQNQGALSVTADLDTRYRTDFKEQEFLIQGLGLSARQIFSDRIGDRLLLFFFLNWQQGFKELKVDQVNLLYKGPLGKWQWTFGRYRLPFGLLPNYSTKRLLFPVISEAALGTDVDNGVMLSGLIGDFDYGASLSQGAGMEWTKKVGPLLAFRLGHQNVEFEEFRFGLSGLWGKVIMDETLHLIRLLSFDLIKYFGPGVLRSEGVIGKKEEKVLSGIFGGFDYAILPRTDLNLGIGYLNLGKEVTITGGLTYNITIFGLPTQFRIGQKFNLRGGENEFTAQIYNYLSRNF